jgi:hypothetical protein
MVENDEENSTVDRFNIDSKFMRVLLILVSVFLVFAGPTYVSYLLANVLKVNYVASVVSGFALLIVGLFLMWFLIRKKVIT